MRIKIIDIQYTFPTKNCSVRYTLVKSENLHEIAINKSINNQRFKLANK